MKKKLFVTTLLVAATACTSLMALAACGGGETEDPVYSAPVITVNPPAMEITQGDEVSLIYGVTVTDEYDTDLRATVSNDGGFDAEVVGEYTVTYSATNSKGKTGTATREYTVVAPLPGYVLEVQKENDRANWVEKLGKEEKKMVFTHEDYYELSANANFETAISGIFHNVSGETVTLTVAGSHGESAVLNAAGAVIEARDGANGKLVNKDNPSRPSSTATSIIYTDENGDEQTGLVPALFASYMQIPAGGFAIVVQNSGQFDEDGRGWLNKNLVYQYGAAARIYTDAADGEELTVYVDQAPVVLNAPNVSVRVGNSSADVNELLTAGITYFDDNGTFVVSDDVTEGLTVEVMGGGTPVFDVNTEGNYLYRLKITDNAGNATEFTRTVVVTPATPETKTVIIDGEWYEFGDFIAVNPENVSKPGDYEAIIYTSYFNGTYFNNNYGAYFVVGADGKINEAYSVWANKIFTLGADGEVTEQAGTSSDVLSQVTLEQDEYVVLAVNGGANGAAFRTALGGIMKAEKKYMLGMDVQLALIGYLPEVTVTKADGSSASYAGQKVVVNQTVSAGDASKASFLVYTYGSVETLTCNGWGVAAVIDADGKIVKVYDGANGYFHTYENGAEVKTDYRTDRNDPSTEVWNREQVVSIAFGELEEGQTLVVFPRDDTAGNDSPHKWASNNLRGNGVEWWNFTVEIEEQN